MTEPNYCVSSYVQVYCNVNGDTYRAILCNVRSAADKPQKCPTRQTAYEALRDAASAEYLAAAVASWGE